MKIIIYIMLLSLFPCSCRNYKKSEKEIMSINEMDRTADELESAIIKKGSIEAYNSYIVLCLEDKRLNLYKMSKIMADKYNYTPAYYRVFSTILDRKNDYYTPNKEIYNLEGLTDKEKQEAINYLKMGAEKGEEQCINRIKGYIKEKRYFSDIDMNIWQ